MSWFKTIFGGPSSVPAAERSTSDARAWLLAASGRDFEWRDLGDLVPSERGIFVGDPTCEHDYHIQPSAPVETVVLRVWVLHSGAERLDFEAQTNTLISLEASGAEPASRGDRSTSVSTRRASRSGAWMRETRSRGSAISNTRQGAATVSSGSFPISQERSHFARWLEIPPDGHRMFVASAGNDGGFAAVWLHDENQGLSGILVDIGGRAGDGLFLDKLLPAS